MPEPFAIAGADYLEQLLRAAIDVPAAAGDPASGRVVARLMVALGARGEDERLEPYLSCSPGRRSVYEVTCYDEADRPTSRVTDRTAGQAIRAAARFAADRPDRRVEVVARDETGRERCVLVASRGTATYQFPEAGAVDGGAPAPTVEPASTRPDPRVADPRVADPRVADPRVADPRVADPRVAQWAAITDRLESLPTTDDVVTALRDVGVMATDVRERLGSLPTTDELIAALRDLLGGMTIELDATAVEDVIHAALDEVPRVPTAPTPTVTTMSDVDESAPADVGAVGDGPARRARESAGSNTTPVQHGVRIDAAKVADQPWHSSPGQAKNRTGRTGRAKPAAEPPDVIDRPPSDRPVDDTLVLVALSNRRH